MLRRQRIDLAVGFGVLMVLAGTVTLVTLVVVASSQVARLAAMGMDIVAGVSHDLRTPQSAIWTMEENTAGGVVGSERTVERYGGLIRDYVRRLVEMIEDTLQLSAVKAGTRPFQIGKVDVASVVAETVARPMIDQAVFDLVHVRRSTCSLLAIPPATLN